MDQAVSASSGWSKKSAPIELAVAKTPHSPDMNIRVLRSAAILKRLVHHPNIVHLLEIVKDNGKFILIQEYVEGPTLQQLLEQNISPLDKENLFSATGLGYLLCP